MPHQTAVTSLAKQQEELSPRAGGPLRRSARARTLRQSVEAEQRHSRGRADDRHCESGATDQVQKPGLRQHARELEAAKQAMEVERRGSLSSRKRKRAESKPTWPISKPHPSTARVHKSRKPSGHSTPSRANWRPGRQPLAAGSATSAKTVGWTSRSERQRLAVHKGRAGQSEPGPQRAGREDAILRRRTRVARAGAGPVCNRSGTARGAPSGPIDGPKSRSSSREQNSCDNWSRPAKSEQESHSTHYEARAGRVGGTRQRANRRGGHPCGRRTDLARYA